MNTLFLENITKLKQRVFIRTFGRIVVLTLFIFVLLYTISVGLEKTGTYRIERDVAFYLVAFVVAMVGASSVVYFTRAHLLTILIDIDTRLRLKDRLSTAYEYHSIEKNSEFSEALFEDAGRSLDRLSNKQLLPFKFSMVYSLFIFVLLINVAFIIIDRFAPPSFQSLFDQSDRQTQHSSESQDAQKYPKEARQLEDEERDSLAEKMQDAAKQLEDKSVSQEELSSSLKDLLQEVQGTQEQLMNGTESLDDATNLDNMSIRQIPQSPALSSQGLQNLEQLLKNMMSGQSPGELQQGMRWNSEELQQLADLLSELAEQLGLDEESGLSEANEGENSASGGTGSEQDMAENNDESSQSNGDSEGQQDGEDGSAQALGREGEGPNLQKGAGATGSGDMGDEFGDGEYDGGTFGLGRADGQEYPPSTPERLNNPVVQDKLHETQKEDYNIHIRSVTRIGKATLPEEDLTRPYRQELESILQKEDIPLNYREYIKNYFMSIGLEQGN